MTKKEDPTHKMGKFTGYHVLPDGSMKIAPAYVDSLLVVRATTDGINAMLDAVTTHAAEMHTKNGRLYDKLWDEITEDLGLEREGYRYTLSTEGILTRENKNK